MPDPAGVPPFKEFSPTMRIDVLVGDWRTELPPEGSSEEKERALYDRVWAAYQEGDYGFGLWCWHECDRLTNALGGSVRDVTRILGEGRYLGFSHRRAIAERVPLDRVHRPRKGEMSTPRPDATVLAIYQLLCVYAVRARAGDAKAKAELAIALLEHDERRRADAFYKHFETFQRLLERADAPKPPAAAAAPAAEPPAPVPASGTAPAARRAAPRPRRGRGE
jgi:hypothetical protein